MLTPGQTTGTMDFTITSTTGMDTLSEFNLELLILPAGTPTSLLQFSTSSQPSVYDHANYVFAGESSVADTGGFVPFWGAPFPQTNGAPGYPNDYAYDRISGGDIDDGSGATPSYVTIPQNSGLARTYLASVQFQVQPGTVGTEQFIVSLVNDPTQTYFHDANGNSLTYSYSGGSVTVEGGASQSLIIPEPTSTLTGLTGTFFFAVYGWLRHRGSK
jgi:hypothetical protein